MSKEECPTCGRSNFASERDMKLHHTAAHGRSISNRAERKFECEWCDETFTREVNQGSSRRFCSHSCATKHQHSLQGNQLKDGESVRSRVLWRDNYTCQRCGCTVNSGHRKSQRSTEVHHLIPRAAGGPDAKANLVTLCFRCHMEAHRQMSHIHESNPELLEELRNVVCDEG